MAHAGKAPEIELLITSWREKIAHWESKSKTSKWLDNDKIKIKYANDILVKLQTETFNPQDLLNFLDEIARQEKYETVKVGSRFRAGINDTRGCMEVLILQQRGESSHPRRKGRPTPYEYFCMSDAAYDEADREAAALDKLKKFDSQWSRVATFEGMESMRALLFVNIPKKQVVIAYRGTASKPFGARVDNILVDLKSVLNGNSKGHKATALQLPFNNQTQLYLKPGFHLSFTGHSLGGHLAEGALDIWSSTDFVTTMTREGYSHLQDIYLSASAVTFDSPGYNKAGEERRKSPGLLRSISFKFWPNPINMALKPLNENNIYILTPKLQLDMGGALANLNVIHGMQTYQDCFDVTGYPKEGHWKRMHAWPALEPKRVEALLHSEHLVRADGSLDTFNLFFGLALRGIMALIPYSDMKEHYLKLKNEIVGSRTAASAFIEENERELAEAFIVYKYLEDSRSHSELMRAVHISIFPTAIQEFMRAWSEFNRLAATGPHQAIIEDYRQHFYKEYKLRAEDCLLLQNFNLEHEVILLLPGYPHDIFIFEHHLCELYANHCATDRKWAIHCNHLITDMTVTLAGNALKKISNLTSKEPLRSPPPKESLRSPLPKETRFGKAEITPLLHTLSELYQSLGFLAEPKFKNMILSVKLIQLSGSRSPSEPSTLKPPSKVLYYSAGEIKTDAAFLRAFILDIAFTRVFFKLAEAGYSLDFAVQSPADRGYIRIYERKSALLEGCYQQNEAMAPLLHAELKKYSKCVLFDKCSCVTIDFDKMLEEVYLVEDAVDEAIQKHLQTLLKEFAVMRVDIGASLFSWLQEEFSGLVQQIERLEAELQKTLSFNDKSADSIEKIKTFMNDLTKLRKRQAEISAEMSEITVNYGGTDLDLPGAATAQPPNMVLPHKTVSNFAPLDGSMALPGRVVDVPGDGNCFFHAVLHELQRQRLAGDLTFAPELQHLELRTRAVAYLRGHPALLSDPIELNDRGVLKIVTQEEYLTEMSQDRAYAEGPIIDALALCLNVHFSITDVRIDDAGESHFNMNDHNGIVRPTIGLIREGQHYRALELAAEHSIPSMVTAIGAVGGIQGAFVDSSLLNPDSAAASCSVSEEKSM